MEFDHNCDWVHVSRDQSKVCKLGDVGIDSAFALIVCQQFESHDGYCALILWAKLLDKHHLEYRPFGVDRGLIVFNLHVNHLLCKRRRVSTREERVRSVDPFGIVLELVLCQQEVEEGSCEPHAPDRLIAIELAWRARLDSLFLSQCRCHNSGGTSRWCRCATGCILHLRDWIVLSCLD